MPYKISIDLNGLEAADRAIREEARRLCKDQAEAHAEEMKGLLTSHSGSGRKYGELPKVSSAPGDAPVSQSGGLVDSIEVVPVEGGFATVVSGPALFLEFGTSKMSPRPFVEEALERVKGEQ